MGGRHPFPGSSLILLVHGYNNDQYEAAGSFYRMRCNLDNILSFSGLPESVRRNAQEHIWEFFWPGYQPIPVMNPQARRRSWGETVISATSYSHEVRKARSWVSENLFKYLLQIQPADIFFISHSLGCRVVLETVRGLQESLLTRISVRGFLLMAAAVPVHLLRPGGPLRPSAEIPPKKYCLYSRRDMVLFLAFPPGELFSGEAPIYGSPIAIGRHGWPSSMFSSRENTSLGHGDYWTKGVFSQESHNLGEICAGIFGFAIDRKLANVNIPVAPEARRFSILPENQLVSTALPGTGWLSEYSQY